MSSINYQIKMFVNLKWRVADCFVEKWYTMYNTVPKTFYIHTWTESKRKAHAERTLSEGRAHGEWTNGERKLNGIGWVGVNSERMQNAKVAQTGTQGEPWMHYEH